MPKPSSSGLFQLIKSLSGPEKRYFKVSLSSQRGNTEYNCAQLFNAIDKQDKYDEKEIAANKTFSRHLSKQKERLYEMILKRLRMYHSNSSENMKIQAMLNNIEILFVKGIYDSCEKIINKVKKYTEQNEQFLLLRQVLDWERLLLHRHKESATVRKKIQINLKTQLAVFEKEKNTLLFRDLFNNISLIAVETIFVRNKNTAKELKKLMQNPLLKNPEKALTFSAKMNFYDIHRFYHVMIGNNAQAYFYIIKLVELFESRDYEKYKRQYFAALLNLNMTEALLGREPEYKATTAKIITQLGKSPELQVMYFPYKYLNKFLLINKMGEFSETPSVVRNFVKELAVHNEITPKGFLVVTYVNISISYFGKQDYKEALGWLNKVLSDDSQKGFREDVYSTAHILNLIIHYELGNDKLLEYAVLSTYRFLQGRENLYEFEKIFLHFIRVQLPKANSRSEVIGQFKVLLSKLMELTKDNYEKRVLDNFDFISWLESKIKNRPFAEIVKEKAKREII